MDISGGQSEDAPFPRKGFGAWRVVLTLVILGIGLYGAASYLSQLGKSPAISNALIHDVARRDFELVILERGEIESVGDAEIRSEVRTQNSPGLAILRLVAEGAEVAEGDFLVELDSSALLEEKTTQQILVNTAKALEVEARNIYETAMIAKEEYLDGIYVQERQTIESEVFVAEESLSRAQEYLLYSKNLAAKGYVNDLQLEADAFAVDKSRKELEAAKTKLRVLDDYTKAKMLKQLESDIVTAKARWESQTNSHQLERDKLLDMEDQIAKCMIHAPRAGVVKYAHDNNRHGENNFIVEEGAVIRERQTIIRLPNTAEMQVDLTVNESLVQYVEPGMEALIEPVGLDGAVLRGEVLSINQYAEPSGWRKANVKEYKAHVAILDDLPDLRPGMTASVTIQSLSVPDALQTPVQAVYAHGDLHYCFVQRGGQFVPQRVECGPTNDRFYVIESGLSENDQVALNPRELLDQVTLPELPNEVKQQTVSIGAKLREKETPLNAKAQNATPQNAVAKKESPSHAKPKGG